MDRTADPAAVVATRSRNLVMSAIKATSILSTKVPGAALLAWGLPSFTTYVFPRVVAPHRNDVQFSHDLLREARVTVTPGSAIGSSGAHYVRMAYCVEDDVINLAFDRMEAYFGR